MKPTSSLLDQPLPGDPKNELAVLGSLVLLRSTDEVDLNEQDFLDEGFGKAYRILKSAHEAGLAIDDPVIIKAQFAAAGLSDKHFGSAFITRIVNAVPNAAHLNYYAGLVCRDSIKRRLIDAFTKGLRRAYDPTMEPVDAIAAAEDELARIAGHVPISTFTIGDATAEAIAELEAPEVSGKGGVMSGLREVDDVAGPLNGGEFGIIAARPAQGKTSLLSQILLHNAGQGRPGLLVSLEMTQREIANRALCSGTGIDSRDLRERKIDAPLLLKLKEYQGNLAELPIHLWAPPSATVAQIRGIARYLHSTRGVSMVAVDYLGLVKPSPDERRLPRHEQVQLISAGLKELAKELNLPVLAACQLNREADGEEPRLSHLRESGAIEQDADLVMFIHHCDQDLPRADGMQPAWIVIGKHRHGETGRIPVLWKARETRFVTFNEDA